MDISNETLYKMVESQLQGFGARIERHEGILNRLPRDLREIMKEHRETCEAYRHFDDLNARTSEITGVVNVHEEQLKWAKERLDKKSNPPRNKAPWWAPSFVKIALAALGIIGGAGAWGFTCSTSRATDKDTSRGAQPPVASVNPQD